MRVKILILPIALLLISLKSPAQELAYSNYWFAYNTVQLDRPIAADSAIAEVGPITATYPDGRMLLFFCIEGEGPVYQIFDHFGNEAFSSPQSIAPLLADGCTPLPVPDLEGGFYAIWVGIQEYPTTGLYAQHLDSSGYRIWGDRGKTLLPNYGEGSKYDVSQDGMGGFLVVYPNDENIIKAFRINERGQRVWGEEDVVICDDPDCQDKCKITLDGCGGAYVVWMDWRYGYPRGFMQKVDSTGQVLWEPNGVYFYPYQPLFINIIPDNAGGFIFHSGSSNYGRAYRVDPNGHILWSRDQVSYQIWAELAEGDSGFFYTAYPSEDLRSVYAQKIDMEGHFYWGEYPGLFLGNFNNYSPGSYIISLSYRSPYLYAAFDFNPPGGLYPNYLLAQCINSSGDAMWETDGVLISILEDHLFSCFDISPDSLWGLAVAYEKGGGQDVFGKHINIDGTLGGIKPLKITVIPSPGTMSISKSQVAYELNEVGPISLEIFDLLGRRVRTLKEGYSSPGNFIINLDNSDLSSGIYLLRLNCPAYQVTKKFVVIR